MRKEDFAAWNEKMAHLYDPDDYHRSGNSIVRWIEKKRVRMLLQLMHARPNDSVLEVGVGAGNILEQVSAERRVGIDLSHFLLEKAEQRLRGKATLVQGDAEDLLAHFPEGSFDKVFCSEVLEHVQHPKKVLEQMAACLKDDGIAVVSVPNERVINILKSILKSIGVFRLLFPRVADRMEDEWHLHVFSRQLLVELSSSAFDVETIRSVPFSFLPIRLVARLRPKRYMHLEHLLAPEKAHHTVSETLPQDSDNAVKNFFKRWPAFYNFLVVLIGPSFFTGFTSKRFVKTLPANMVVLNAGSGVRRLSPMTVNVDLFAFPGVDVTADLRSLPFRDNVFDAATCEQVLEHVSDPHKAVSELCRVVKPGGKIHVASPFLFPWHPSPSDYTRWTQEGLRSLFPDSYTVVQQGVIAGPFSALNAFLPAFLSTILCFGLRPLQSALQYVFLIVFFPIKLLDIVFAHFPGAELCAANFYLIVEKSSDET